MIKLDARVAQALTNLRASSDFQKFVEMIGALTVVETQKVLTSVETLQIGRVQGRVLMLQEILTAINDAPAILEKLIQK